MRRVTMLLIFVPVICAGAVKLAEDPPPLPPPRSGDIGGAIHPVEKVVRVRAVSRVTGRTYSPNGFDKKTHRFTFKNLPGDATYDICIRTADGRTIEGIDLDSVDARLLRLAAQRRKQLGLPPERQHKFSPDDVKELLRFVRDMKDFMEVRRVVYLRGHGRRATMLVELMRTREFYHSKENELIWRIELWYFENQFGGWVRLPNQERVLLRKRISEPKWREISIEYFPQLSVYIGPDGSSQPVAFEIPKEPDPSRGRVAGTPIELKTAAHIDGLDVKPPAASQPATAPSK